MNIVATVEARMASTRFPGKTLAPIMGRPMLELLIERLQQAWRVDRIVVATTTDASDDPIEALARRCGAGCFRGSTDDVLDRVLRAAQASEADLIVEMVGDCPLLDPQVVDQVIDLFLSHDVDYASNILKPTYPVGVNAQVFPTHVLAEVAELTQDPADREHVSPYIYEHPERYRRVNLTAPPEVRRPNLRLTVDTEEDLGLVREIYDRLYPGKPDFTLYDVVRLLDNEPELVGINADILQKPVR